jgi:hypothetical protein
VPLCLCGKKYFAGKWQNFIAPIVNNPTEKTTNGRPFGDNPGEKLTMQSEKEF